MWRDLRGGGESKTVDSIVQGKLALLCVCVCVCVCDCVCLCVIGGATVNLYTVSRYKRSD